MSVCEYGTQECVRHGGLHYTGACTYQDLDSGSVWLIHNQDVGIGIL